MSAVMDGLICVFVSLLILLLCSFIVEAENTTNPKFTAIHFVGSLVLLLVAFRVTFHLLSFIAGC